MTRNELRAKLILMGKRNIDVILEMRKNGFSVACMKISR